MTFISYYERFSKKNHTAFCTTHSHTMLRQPQSKAKRQGF